jgi:hypothetical protein
LLIKTLIRFRAVFTRIFIIERFKGNSKSQLFNHLKNYDKHNGFHIEGGRKRTPQAKELDLEGQGHRIITNFRSGTCAGIIYFL